MSFNPQIPHNHLPLLPPGIIVEDPEILQKAIKASRALAKLSSGKALPNQTVLLNTIVLQEARQSSAIENIITTDDELYEALSEPEKDITPHTKEVLHYAEALWAGMKSIEIRPLSTNTFVEIVQIIKQSNAGIRKNPGTKIANSKSGEAIYTPPEGEELIRKLLNNLEQFFHEENGIDPLIKMAIGHYQFEAIHPFADGNGRTGRIINILYLVSSGLLELPVLYLSKYIIEHKDAYYNNLLEVTKNNNWKQWILYILDAVEVTAGYTDQKIQSILQAMQLFEEKCTSQCSFYSKELRDILFQQPYCKAKFLVDAGIAKELTARKYLREIAAVGLLEEKKVGRENLYINKNFLKVLTQ